MQEIQQTHVSFDIFDTLIKRSVAQPSDIFRLMEQYGKCQGTVVPAHFAELRMNAERIAAAKLKKPVTLSDIYRELERQIGQPVNELMELELSFEFQGCRPNHEYVPIFNGCVRAGKTVVLISDMYLPSDAMEKMLDKCGINGYKKLYISCEAGCTKSEGFLYKLVLRDLGISANQLLHFGDNQKSDIWIPRSLGIHARRVPCRQKELCAVPKEIAASFALIYRTLEACIANVSYGMDLYGRLGCKTFGPLLAGFTQWLAGQLDRDGIHDVYFMSRDGYTMKQAFDAAYGEKYATHYLYCSRRSYTVPLIWKHPELSEIFKNITVQDRMTLRVFVTRLGLEPEQCIPYAQQCGIVLDEVFEHGTFKTSEKVVRFYDSVRHLVIENSRKEYDALLEYITSLHMEKRIAVVDIGRHGTMQNALEELIREAQLGIEVKGYYVGVLPDAPLVNTGLICASGYLHERGKNEEFVNTLSAFVPIFESVFLGQHGSVKRFIRVEGKAELEMYEFEYESQEKKRCDEISIMREYQHGAITFVKEFAKAFPGGLLPVPARIAWRNFTVMCLKPALWEAKLWGDFRVFDNIIMLVAPIEKATYYLRHPRRLKNDFMACVWKIGFMKRLFKLPLPYDRLYWIMKHRFNKG